MLTTPLRTASTEFMPKRQICSQLQGWEQGTHLNTQGTGEGKAVICIYLPPVQRFQLVARLPQQASSQMRTWLRSVLSLPAEDG